MAANTFKRKEVKFILNKEQKMALLNEIGHLLVADKFKEYTITNIYMDTEDSRLIRKSIEKPIYKEKMRVRSYGKADEGSNVFVELKKKYQGIVYKRRIKMPLIEAKSFIKRDTTRNGQVEDEIEYFIDFYKGIKPAMYISYKREAFKGILDNELRVTFDDEILWRDENLSLSSEIYGNPILGEDQYVMEIKCEDSMPLWLTNALASFRIYKTSFSKYGKAYLKQQQMEVNYV